MGTALGSDMMSHISNFAVASMFLESGMVSVGADEIQIRVGCGTAPHFMAVTGMQQAE